MTTSKDNGFFKSHYEWIALGIAVLVLVGGALLYMQSLGEDAETFVEESVQSLARRQPGGEKVTAVDMSGYAHMLRLAKTPLRISTIADDAASFLASEHRVFCENAQCKQPIPFMAHGLKCPFCGWERKEAAPVVADADDDGLPDTWERAHGLNPKDPADAGADADGDGFTNAEEFAAKTDPKDKSSHPDYLDYLVVTLPLKETVMPFYFVEAHKVPAGMKFQFKDPSRIKEFDRGVYAVLADEAIGKTGFVAKEFVTQTKKIKMGGGMSKTVDDSYAVVERKADGKRVRMAVNRKAIPIDVQAQLTYSRSGGKTFNVVKGDKIELNGAKYKVLDIVSKGKGATVTLEDEALGKQRTIEALAQ